MKRVLLMGVYGEIGENIYYSLKDDHKIYAFMNRNKANRFPNVTPIYKDPYKLDDMVEVVQSMDLVIFFEDPIMRFNRLTQGRFDTFFELIADNLGRAAEKSEVTNIIYISEEIPNDDAKEILNSYDTNVVATQTQVLRFGKSLKYKNPDNMTMRSAQKAQIPRGWSLRGVSQYYFKWIGEIIFGMFEVKMSGADVYIYLKNTETPLLMLKHRRTEFHGIIVYDVIGGRLANNTRAWLEFRALPGDHTFIMALHDFNPSLPWPIYVITEAPLHALISRIYQVEMVINDTIVEENIRNNPDK